jgi:hypothetical protein
MTRSSAKRAAVVARDTAPPDRATTLCVDKLGPLIPRAYPAARGWSPDGHRIKAPLDYGRGPEKVWVYSTPRVRDGQTVTLTALARNTAGCLQLLEAVAAGNPTGDLFLIGDNLASHRGPPIVARLEAHPRVQQVFIPVAACWPNLQEARWRLVRREALAGQSFADGAELAHATAVATAQLNRRTKPWVWNRPPKPHRQLHGAFIDRP